jgi:hypothetical protein
MTPCDSTTPYEKCLALYMEPVFATSATHRWRV